MKKHIIIITITSLLALAGCSASDKLPEESQQSATQQKGIRISIGLDQAVETYSTVTASNPEKRLFSIAFFVETADGTFHKFVNVGKGKPDTAFPFDDIVFGVTNPNSASSVNSIEMVIPDGYWGNARVAAIGNFEYNGMTDQVLAVESMDDVLALRHTLDANAKPTIRLLLYYQDVWNLTPDTDLSETIEMKRVAARIDIPFGIKVNGTAVNLVDKINQGKAQIYLLIDGQKTASYVFPANPADINTIAAMPCTTPVLMNYGTAIEDNTIRVVTFYTYEMTGSDTQPLTAHILLKLRETNSDSSPWVETLYPIALTDSEGRSIFVRNNYYLIDSPYAMDANIGGDWDEGVW